MRVIVIAGIIVLLFGIFLFFDIRDRKKKALAFIHKQYGNKPVAREYEWKNIEKHWNEVSETLLKDEKIDDITWNDLDMNQVFGRLNGCQSFAGEQLLYSTLHILRKDEAAKQLIDKKSRFYAENENERVLTQLQLKLLGKEEGSYYLPMFIKNIDAFAIENIWFYRILQVLLFVSFIPVLLFKQDIYLLLPVVIVLINACVYALKKNQFEVHLISLNGMIKLVKSANRISDLSGMRYEKEFGDLKKPAEEFKAMNRMIGRMEKKQEARFSGDAFSMLYDLIIGTTMWDFTTYHKILKIIEGKQDAFIELYERIGEIDMAISMASFRSSVAFSCRPELSVDREIEMEDIYHPLVDEPVCNTVKLDKGSIITGSNASGKSTFMKAVMINIIMAQSMNLCTARRLVIPSGRVITSMAVRDDVMSGESYYIKEIKYLKRIIDNISNNRLVFCGIDEILRGTNTEERIAASVSILDYLFDKNCISIVASHDIELTEMLKDKYQNYHFRELVGKDDIEFEYKIHQGPAVTKNAIRLLEYVKFPPEIVRDARAICAEAMN